MFSSLELFVFEEEVGWWIVDILVAQQQVTTMKKEDQKTPKLTHGAL
jgi:hypothetical protein